MKDLVGREMTPVERRLVVALRGLEGLLKEDLAPAVEANVKEALVALWIAVTDLGLRYERPDGIHL